MNSTITACKCILFIEKISKINNFNNSGTPESPYCFS